MIVTFITPWTPVRMKLVELMNFLKTETPPSHSVCAVVFVLFYLWATLKKTRLIQRSIIHPSVNNSTTSSWGTKYVLIRRGYDLRKLMGQSLMDVLNNNNHCCHLLCDHFTRSWDKPLDMHSYLIIKPYHLNFTVRSLKPNGLYDLPNVTYLINDGATIWIQAFRLQYSHGTLLLCNSYEWNKCSTGNIFYRRAIILVWNGGSRTYKNTNLQSSHPFDV